LTPCGDEDRVSDRYFENFVNERWWKEWRPNLSHTSPPFTTIENDGEIEEGP
jgi:hypothetical protein